MTILIQTPPGGQPVHHQVVPRRELPENPGENPPRSVIIVPEDQSAESQRQRRNRKRQEDKVTKADQKKRKEAEKSSQNHQNQVRKAQNS